MPAKADAARRPVLYVFFGLIATGKSTLAAAWAEQRGLAYANSDVIRKELAGLRPKGEPCDQLLTGTRPEAPDQGIYTPEFSRKTYDELLRRAEAELGQGRDMVLDASYLDRAERERVVALAAQTGANLRFILCDCSDQVKQERLALRARDPQAVSDGRWEIYLRQREKFQPPSELPPDHLITIDTNQPLPTLLATLAQQLPRH